VLNPDLSVPNVDMKDAAVDAVRPVPAGVHEFVVIVGLVKDDLDLHVPARGLILSIRLDDLPNRRPTM
jgi:hypothetical protein